MTANRRLVTPLAGALLVLAVVGCQKLQANLHQHVRGLNGEPLVQPQAGNCTIDQLEAREEGFRAAGGVGGLAVLQTNVGSVAARPDPVDSPATAAAVVDAVLDPTTPATSAAILVLDDFSGVFTLGTDLFALDASDFDDPTVGHAAELAAKLDSLVENGQLSHGALVMNHLLALLEELVAPSSEEVGEAEVKLVLGNARLVVGAVDIEDFRTDAIASRLRAAIDGLTADEIRNIVVNMSFSIVPCSVLEDYEASGYTSFDDYIEALAAHHGYAFMEELLLGLATTPLPNDPLLTLTESEVDQAPAVIYVASAGNYGLGYPLAPAGWENVIAVSSNDVHTSVRSGFSNAGEVMIDGAWFLLADAFGRSGVTEPEAGKSVVYAGTSFAAPAVAAYSALDLMASGTRCGLDPGDGLRPRLAHGHHVDVLLATAILDVCTAP